MSKLNYIAGEEIGKSDWFTVTQDMFTEFETLTKSNDPLHMDPEWVRNNTNMDSTIAPGFLTVSLLPFFIQQFDITPEGYYALNYGFDKIRWPSPIPVNSDIRAVMSIKNVDSSGDSKKKIIITFNVVIEVKNSSKPAMIAEWLGAIISSNS